MFGLDARMRRFQNEVKVRKLDEVFCECGNGDARRIIWNKLMRPVDPDDGSAQPEYIKPPCTLEVCNPKPDPTVWPVMKPADFEARAKSMREVTKKLMGDDWEEREVIGHVAEEAKDRSAEPQLEILEKIKPVILEPTGDKIRDAVAARLLKNRELSREELAKKLLVPTDQGRDD